MVVADLNPTSTIRLLLQERPAFHGLAGENRWSLADDVLLWLFDALTPTDVTLETGCGYSTIIFALKQTKHTVISPIVEEHRRIQDWGLSHNVDFSNVEFVAEKSEVALPHFDCGPLGVVLIDGWHAFPAPMVDWFYACRQLKTGGYVVIDDTQIRSCRILCDFLSAEKGRWKIERRFKRTDVFRRLSFPMFEGDWRSQTWGSSPCFSWRDYWSERFRPGFVKGIDTVPGLKQALLKFRRGLFGR